MKLYPGTRLLLLAASNDVLIPLTQLVIAPFPLYISTLMVLVVDVLVPAAAWPVVFKVVVEDVFNLLVFVYCEL